MEIPPGPIGEVMRERLDYLIEVGESGSGNETDLAQYYTIRAFLLGVFEQPAAAPKRKNI